MLFDKKSLNRWLGLLAMLGFPFGAQALTVETLRRDSTLTPLTFARHFAGFQYRFHAEVQTPEKFLASRSGDCDDYATLASAILKSKGYTTRLISVRMKSQVHVVCYVEEARGYLDYNARASSTGIVRSTGSLRDIADKVAASFGEPWSSVSEFVFIDRVKRLVRSDLPVNSPEKLSGLPQAAGRPSR